MPSPMTTRPPCRTLRPNFGPSAAPEVAAPIARPERQRGHRDTGVHRAEAEPELDEQVDDQHTPFIATKNDARKTTPATNPRLLNSERSITGCALRRSLTDEGGEDERGGDHHQEAPDRPAVLATLDQRVDQQRRGGGQQHRPPRRASPRGRGGGAGRYLTARTGADDADRHVDQEDHPPAGAEQVGVDQEAGDDRAEHRGQPHDRAERDERLLQVVGGERLLHHRQPLGIITAPKRPCRTRDAISSAGGRRQPAQQGGDGEADHADDEHPAPPDQVAGRAEMTSPTAKDIVYAASTHCRVLCAAAEVGLDRRAGQVGDRRVEQVHDVGDDDDGHDHPAVLVAARTPGCAAAPADRRGGGVVTDIGCSSAWDEQCSKCTNTVLTPNSCSCQVHCSTWPRPRTSGSAPGRPARSGSG